MTDDVASLVLEQLRALRNDVRGFHAEADIEFERLKARLSYVQGSLADPPPALTPAK